MSQIELPLAVVKSRLTTRTSSGILAVYCGRARVGYVASSEAGHLWELCLVSEQMQGHPRGRAPTREIALEQMERTLRAWMRAAGVSFTNEGRTE